MLLSIQCLVLLLAYAHFAFGYITTSALLLAYKLFPLDYITSGLLTRKPRHTPLTPCAASSRAASLISTTPGCFALPGYSILTKQPAPSKRQQKSANATMSLLHKANHIPSSSLKRKCS